MNKLNKRETHKVVDIKHLTNSTFIIYIERKNIVFKPGQYIVLGIKGNNDFRQYSIYSGTNEKYLSILVKEVENGELSPLLKHLETGNEVEIEGPMGHFSISNNHKGGIVMIASGTGIAPFHSFVVSNPNANYKLIHGIRTIDEAYEHYHYKTENYITCTSSNNTGAFNGRVTKYLESQSFKADTLFYLCGNSNMIFDAMDILKAKGVENSNMFAEIYF